VKGGNESEAPDSLIAAGDCLKLMDSASVTSKEIAADWIGAAV